MSWLTGSLPSTRERFALAALAKREPFVKLCHRFHIARSTGYKWVHRFRRHGREGLRNRSRRPHRSPRQLTWRWQAALRQLRRHQPTWGSRKLRARLRQLHPRVHLPVPRTLSRWLRRLKLVSPRPRHQRPGPQLPPRKRTAARVPNDVWTLDFKGWFRTGDGTRVEPLTVRDLKSRFLLDVRLLPNQSEAHTRRALTRLFRRYGLPKVIRVDNGPPFGGVGPRGLSRLSVWWRRLGIAVEFGRPAHPQDNAGHEQMHGVYQIEVAAHPAGHPRAHQRRSDRWRANYNRIRPHEALGLQPPAQHYRVSCRPMPESLPAWIYPSAWDQRRVSPDGRLFWQGRQRFIGRAFGGEIVGLQRQPAGVWKVFLGSDLLGLLYHKDRSRSLRPARQFHR
ncbi:MAG TPA: helix-turn-helix domain-containing protein [Verrucomicrobiae bacterium]|nr:helix-turn-helix domain-containing protein [Verrucomicrobiae bacterium]